jgi:hypothetical protein
MKKSWAWSLLGWVSDRGRTGGWDGRRVDLGGGSFGAIFSLQEGSYHAGFEGLESGGGLGEAPVDGDAWSVGAGEADFGRAFFHFRWQVFCDQMIAQDALMEDFLGFSGNGVGRERCMDAVWLLDAPHDCTRMQRSRH